MDRLRWLSTLVLLAGCGQGGRELLTPAVDLGRLLPAPASIEGWSAAAPPAAYVADNLYEYLDGGAERYLGYGFRLLLHVRYQAGGRDGASVTLDLFDMGNELGAFGIYSSGRPGGGDFRRWGAEGYRSGTVAAAWKGSVFIHGEADDDRPEHIGLLERLVAGACEAAPGDASPPTILAALPPGGLVPRSERWIASDLLGHRCLPGGVVASYELGGTRGELFWSELPNRAAAGRALAELRAHHARAGAIAGEVAGIGSGGCAFTAPHGAGTVVTAGRFVAGVQGEIPTEARERLLRDLVARLDTAGSTGR